MRGRLKISWNEQPSGTIDYGGPKFPEVQNFAKTQNKQPNLSPTTDRVEREAGAKDFLCIPIPVPILHVGIACK